MAKNVTINFVGSPGAGKTLLSNKIYDYLSKEGFNVTQVEDVLTVVEPIEKFKKDNS